jgi:hypothetical protein
LIKYFQFLPNLFIKSEFPVLRLYITPVYNQGNSFYVRCTLTGNLIEPKPGIYAPGIVGESRWFFGGLRIY